MAYAGVMPRRNMARPRPSTTVGNDGCHGRLRPNDGRIGFRSRHTKDGNDRRNLSRSAPNGFKPWVEKGGRGRLIGRTKGGMNRCLAVDWHNRREGPNCMP